jgi:acyl-CoA synthetase (AMP-forming)/AMP-acid ligase II
VITGGENVATAAVAAVLASHPDIDEVAVTGVDDRQWGQRLVAVVVPREGCVVPSVDALRAWCGDKLPAPARPRAVVDVNEIPRLSSGKIDRLAVVRVARERLRDSGDQ